MQFTLTTTGDDASPKQSARAQLTDQQVLLENGYTAVRLPAHRGKLDPPIPLQDAPGPLQAFRLAGGRWTGGSRLLQPEESTERVTDISVRITATGPLFAEAMLRYAFSSGGHYEVRVGLEAEAAVILIREDVDTGLIGAPLLSAEFFSVAPAQTSGCRISTSREVAALARTLMRRS